MSLRTGLPTGTKFSSASVGVARMVGFTDGVSRPFWTDGINTWDIGIDPPSGFLGFNSNVNGSLAPGDYFFTHIYHRSVHHVVGNQPLTFLGLLSHPKMTALADPFDGIRINIPEEPPFQFQSGIDRIELYRTLVFGGMFFHDRSFSYSGAAGTYNSIKADSALGALLEEDHFPPLARPYMLVFNNHMHFWGSVPYFAGTVNVNNGSWTVSGVGMNWTKAVVGKEFRVEGDSQGYLVLVFISPTAIVIWPPYVGATAINKNYTINLNMPRTEWSMIDSAGNFRPESYPAANFEEFPEGRGEARGMGQAGNVKVLFTEFTSFIQVAVGANTYAKQVLSHGVGCVNASTICNESEAGDLLWMDNNYQIRRSNGSPGQIANLSIAFIGNILNGTHTGIHRNLRQDISKVDKARMFFYPHKNWLMLFFVLAGSGATNPNACLVMDMTKNPFGSKEGPSPWGIWTLPTEATSVGLIPDSTGVLRPYYGDSLGFIWIMDDPKFNDGVPSGTAKGTATGITPTTLTDIGAAFYTAGDGLKGVPLRTYDTNRVLTNDVLIMGNTATGLTIAGWTTQPSPGVTYEIGGIIFQRHTKATDYGAPDRTKILHYLSMSFDKAASSRNLTVYQFTDKRKTQQVIGGQNLDVGADPPHRLGIKQRGFQNQLMFQNTKPDEPITITSWKVDAVGGGNK